MAMAKRKKNRDFLPDKPRSGLLDKLYVTKKQQQTLLRWTLYALVVLACLLIQDTVMSQVRILRATTDLVPCAIFLICLLESTESGCLFCMISAQLFFHAGSAPGAYVIILFTFIGLGVSIFRQSYLRQGFAATALCTAAALLAYELAVMAICLATGLTRSGRISVYFTTWLLSLAGIPILYPICKAIHKIGGETWKE